MPLTIQGKEVALTALKQRREANKDIKPIDNASLPAGSPMYFYCITCGNSSDCKLEGYLSSPRKLCTECQALKDAGWLE